MGQRPVVRILVVVLLAVFVMGGDGEGRQQAIEQAHGGSLRWNFSMSATASRLMTLTSEQWWRWGRPKKPQASAAARVSAGVDQAIAFPAADMTLFGTSTVGQEVSTYTWSMDSGPAAVTFSASWSRTTTVTFTQAGTYVLRLTSTDTTATTYDTMTATVSSAASQTAYYVDPTYSGGGSTGSAAAPWTSLGAAGSSQWNAINSALASGPVIVYFSARVVGSDTSEVTGAEVPLRRTDTSTNRLTIDGMSKYNTNDSSGSWSDYGTPGTCKARECYKIAITSGGYSIGVQGSDNTWPANYTTLRGFEITSNGASARVLPTGNQSVLEHFWVHDITTGGATVQFATPMFTYPDCTAAFGNQQDITIRNNIIENGYGEGIYIPGTFFSEAQGGCLDWGQTHNYILIEGNTIDAAGTGGGQGDGLDLKGGLRNVTIRGNTVTNSPASTRALIMSGIFPDEEGDYIDRADYLIEGNFFYNNSHRCMEVGNGNYVIFRNNVCADNAGGIGIGLVSPVGNDLPFTLVRNVWIYNNTIVNTTTSISLADAESVVLRNNLIAELASGVQMSKTSGAAQPNSDYNVLITGRTLGGSWSEGGNSIFLTNGAALFTDRANDDYTLASGAGALEVATSLVASFAVDFLGIVRPQSSLWDAGAYERVP
jgi:hypothetical protein